MKISATVLAATLATAAAFTAPSPKTVSSTSLKMADVPMPEQREKSRALPFLDRPEALDGTYAGDAGFDPLGLARNSEDLRLYREAEIKHARLAMLCAVGWPLAELLNKQLAADFDLKPVLDASDRIPTVLNGGLEKISPVYWAAVVLGAAAIDLIQLDRSKKANYAFPGDLGWDPLKLFPKDKAGQERMQLAEIKHGRLAMIAVAAYAFNEFVSQSGIINESWMQPLKDAFMA